MKPPSIPAFELFSHKSDMGIRAFGNTMAEAFEQAGYAMTAMVTDLEKVNAEHEIAISCKAPESDILFMDWLNSIIYEMATRNMLFSRFKVEIDEKKNNLNGNIWGEAVDIARHAPAIEPKAVTFSQLKVDSFHAEDKSDEGKDRGKKIWMAQCVIDV